MVKNVGAHGDAPQEAIGLSCPSPTQLNLGVEVVDELLGLAGDAEVFALGLLENLLQGATVNVVVVLSELPLANKGGGSHSRWVAGFCRVCRNPSCRGADGGPLNRLRVAVGGGRVWDWGRLRVVRVGV